MLNLHNKFRRFFTDVRKLSLPYLAARPAVLLTIPLVTGCIAHFYSMGMGLCALFFCTLAGLKFSRKFAALIMIWLVWVGYLNLFYPLSAKLVQRNTLEGRVVSFPVLTYTSKFFLQTDIGKINIRYKGREMHITPGQRLKLYGAFQVVEPGRNPGEFDFIKYMRSKNLAYDFKSDSIVILKPPGLFHQTIADIRKNIASAIEITSWGGATPIIKAVLLGSRAEISESQKNSFADSGMYHLLAISGLHVGIISLILINLLKLFRIPGKIIYPATAMVLLLYIFITGCSISVIRSVIMFTGLIPGILFERPSQVINNLAFSCCLCLILMPYQILSLGFQLSFLATFFLLYYTGFLSNLDNHLRINNPIVKNITGTIAVSLLLFLVTYPLLAGSIHQVSPWAILANVPALVLTSVLVLSSCLALFLFPFSSYLGGLMGETASMVCSMFSHTVKLTSELPGNQIRVSELDPLTTLSLFGFLLLLPHLKKIKKSKFIFPACRDYGNFGF